MRIIFAFLLCWPSAVSAEPVGKTTAPKPSLSERFLSQDPLVQGGALDDFQALDAAARQRLSPILVKALLTKETSGIASRALAMVGSAVVPDVISVLQQGDSAARYAAARTLGMMGVKAKAAVASLIAASRDRDAEVRSGAISALGRISPMEALPVFREAVKDENADVARNALVAIGSLGPKAKEALPEVMDAYKAWKGGAYETLQGIGPVAAPELALVVKGGFSRDVRSYALNLLGQFRVKDTLPVIIGALDDQELRFSAITALGNFGSEAREVVPRLIADLQALDGATTTPVTDNASFFGSLQTSLDSSEISRALVKIGTPEAKEAARRHEEKKERTKSQ